MRPRDIADEAWRGHSLDPAPIDHQHQGVHALFDADGSYVLGDITLLGDVAIEVAISNHDVQIALAPSGDLDLGSIEVRAEQFYADATEGTAPFIVDSTTLVDNLNADLLDGHEWLDVESENDVTLSTVRAWLSSLHIESFPGYQAVEDLITASQAAADAHAARHTDGSDDIQSAEAGSPGQKGLMTADQANKLDGVATGADVTADNPPQAHAASHQNSGADEISVTGLSGVLADEQNPVAHASEHTDGTDDIQDAQAGSPGQKGLMTADQANKLDGIEAAADVTDATNVDAAGATMNTDTDVSGNSWVLDEDDMSSDSATKVPTQQSVKAYVDSQAGGASLKDRSVWFLVAARDWASDYPADDYAYHENGCVGDYATCRITSTGDVNFNGQWPRDYHGSSPSTLGTTAYIWIIPDTTETIQYDISVSRGGEGDDYDNVTETGSNLQLAVTADKLTKIDISSYMDDTGLLGTPAAAGDLFGVCFASDTNDIQVLGLELKYQAYE